MHKLRTAEKEVEVGRTREINSDEYEMHHFRRLLLTLKTRKGGRRSPSAVAARKRAASACADDAWRSRVVGVGRRGFGAAALWDAALK